jgi:hypothetical protein
VATKWAFNVMRLTTTDIVYLPDITNKHVEPPSKDPVVKHDRARREGLSVG